MFSLSECCVSSDLGVPEKFNLPDPVTTGIGTISYQPKFEVIHDSVEDTTTVSFEVDERMSMTSIGKDFPITSSSYKSKSVVHDFTFHVWAKDTDIKISKFFPNVTSFIGGKTPDVMFIEDRRLYVIEFTTSQTSSKSSLLLAYNEKVEKYRQMLEYCMEGKDRKDTDFYGVTFYVVAINGFGVRSNLQIPESEIRDIGLRYHVASIIHNRLLRMKIINPEDQNLTEEECSILNYLRQIKVEDWTTEDPKSEFSESNYKECCKEFSKDEVTKVLDFCMAQARKEVVSNAGFNSKLSRPQLQSERTKKQLFCYLQELEKKSGPQGFNTHLKSIVNIPFIGIPPYNQALMTFDRVLEEIGVSEDSTFKAWHSALVSSSDSENCTTIRSLETVDLDEVISEEELLESLRQFDSTEEETNLKINKGKYNRVQVDADDSVWEDLASVGVEGKRFKNNSNVDFIRNEKKRSYGLETDLSDLETFMASNKTSHFEVINSSRRLVDSILHPTLLVEQGWSYHNNPGVANKYKKMLQQILHTPFYSFCKIVSDIGNEVANSMKQHCKKHEFVIKRLKDYNIFLLIKPTKGASHCFFSILYLNSEVSINSIPGMEGVFRKPHTNGSATWTDFISLNSSKTVNWCLAESRAISMIPYWLEFYGVEPFELNSSHGISNDVLQEAFTMCYFCLIISLADKAEIEESLTISRFIIMEAFVAYPRLPEPYKMFEKFPTIIRSRLTVFIIRKLILLSAHITSENIQCSRVAPTFSSCASTEVTEVKKWMGLINPYTGFALQNPGQLINLMYLGYVKNKNEPSETNAEGALLEKILVLEGKFTDDIKSRIGRVNKEPGSGTSHEYNIDLIKWACEVTIKNKTTVFQNKNHLKDELSRELIKHLVSTTAEDVFMTLKASSNFDTEYEYYTTYMQDAEERRKERLQTSQFSQSENARRINVYYRSKIIEKSLPYVDGDKLKLSEILPICVEEMKKKKHLRICIFKKQQHGGLREIYVLNFAERVIQYVLERAGRILCSLFPGETMTSPDNKRLLPEQHQADVNSQPSRFSTVTSFTSADAAKWSQNHYSHKFAIMFIKLFPQDWHGFLWSALSLWKAKRIKIGDNLLALFASHDNMKTYSPIIQEVYDGFKGYTESKWIKKDQSFITTSTGMMQGILHYTSSAFHSIINEAVSYSISEHIKLSKSEYDQKMTVTVMQSSDDSGMILSLSSDLTKMPDTASHNLELKRSLYKLAYLHQFKKTVSEEVAIKNSVKTTFHCLRVFEFNSKFFFSNFHYEPDIKLLFASSLVSERESFIERQEELSTLLSSYITTGGSFYSATFLQVGQAMLFYRFLGSSVSNHFTTLFKCLSLLPEPSIGFFMMDNAIFTGLTGLMYNYWIMCKHPRVSSNIKYQLTQRCNESDGILETTSLGMLIRSFFCSFGNDMKLKQLMKRVGVKDDWPEYFDKQPSLLFRKSLTTEEYKYKVSMKLSQRGVSTSLSTGVPLTSIMASSLYILTHSVFRVGEALRSLPQEDNAYQGTKGRKAKLFSIIVNSLTQGGDQLDARDMQILFPFQHTYEELRAQQQTIHSLFPKRRTFEKRRMVTKLRVFDPDQTSNMSIINILKQQWFPSLNMGNHLYSARVISQAFSKLAEVITWLRPSIEASLEASPFDHMHQMYNWLQRFQIRAKTVCLLGAPISSNRGKSNIMAALIMNFGKFFSLAIPSDRERSDASLSVTHAFHLLASVCVLPLTEDTKKAITSAMLDSLPQSFGFDDMKIRSRLNTLYIIKDYLQGRSTSLRLLEMIKKNKAGVIGGWVKRQKYSEVHEKYQGNGVWSGVIEGVMARLEVENEKLSPNLRERLTPEEQASYLGNTVITKIYVDNWDVSRTEDFMLALKNWMWENRISFASTYTRPYMPRSAILIGYYNGNSIATNVMGVPLILDKSRENYWLDIPQCSKLSLHFPSQDEVSKGPDVYIRLKAEYADRRAYQVTICSLKVRSSDLSYVPSIMGSYDNQLVEHLINNSPLAAETCYQHLGTSVGSSIHALLLDICKENFKTKGLNLQCTRVEQNISLLSRVSETVEVRDAREQEVIESRESTDEDNKEPLASTSGVVPVVGWAEIMEEDDQFFLDDLDNDEQSPDLLNLMNDMTEVDCNLSDPTGLQHSTTEDLDLVLVDESDLQDFSITRVSMRQNFVKNSIIFKTLISELVSRYTSSRIESIVETGIYYVGEEELIDVLRRAGCLTTFVKRTSRLGFSNDPVESDSNHSVFL